MFDKTLCVNRSLKSILFLTNNDGSKFTWPLWAPVENNGQNEGKKTTFGSTHFIREKYQQLRKMDVL